MKRKAHDPEMAEAFYLAGVATVVFALAVIVSLLWVKEDRSLVRRRHARMRSEKVRLSV